MGIKWRDLLLVVVLGAIALSILEALAISITVSGIVLSFLLIAGLLGLYFWRNKSDLLPSVLVSFILGFLLTFFPLFIFPLILFPTHFIGYMFPGWVILLVMAGTVGIISVPLGLLARFLAGKVK